MKGADKVIVEFQDGRKFTAKEIRSDPKTDLAILIIDGNNFPSLKMGNSNKIEIGDRVLAIGAPFGLIGSVTAGIISGKGRNLQMNMYEEFIQTDAAINPGNSGGLWSIWKEMLSVLTPQLKPALVAGRALAWRLQAIWLKSMATIT